MNTGMLAAHINSSRNIVNFVYWRQHAATEQEKNVLDARQLTEKGDRAFAEGDLVAAGENYQKGLALAQGDRRPPGVR